MADIGKPQQTADSDSPGGQGQRLFYGWVIVGVMAATGAVSMAMGALNFGLKKVLAVTEFLYGHPGRDQGPRAGLEANSDTTSGS